MSEKHAKALDVMSKAKNYNDWIYRTIQQYIGNCVLEIGCGIGNFTLLLDKGEKVICLDLLSSCIDKAKKRLGHKNNITFIQGDFLNKTTLGQLNEFKFDTIICMNVLEHIEADVDALNKMNALLASHGRVILMVPAGQTLYGTMDQALGHIMRYNKHNLRNKLNLAGFGVLTMRYFNSLGVIGWFLNNKILRRTNLSLSQALFYDQVVIPILSKIENLISPPFGMSLLAVAEKNKT
ncbi:class I SAM-dependent methyltransferase [Patescibacteria group bacterium]|nr:class I SAM-dependent methyltransferase [Patescibacteria group bacterium]